MKLTKEQLNSLASTIDRDIFAPLREKEKEQRKQEDQKVREFTKEELQTLKEYEEVCKKVNKIYVQRYKEVYLVSTAVGILSPNNTKITISNLLKTQKSSCFKSSYPSRSEIYDDLVVGTIEATDIEGLINIIKTKYKIK